jgi:UDP-N-acetylglucosamine 2-epimerase (non-hydrolysing)
MKKKILICFGTRPELIKLLSIIIFLKKKKVEVILCNTSQHKEMLIPLINFYDLSIDYDLNILKKEQSLSELTSRLLNKFDKLLLKVKPNCTIVQGDTSTAFACALSSFYNKIKVFHIEAGLRTNNIFSPWPEELNRLYISKIASHHFAPTSIARTNLIKEGVLKKNISVTGNTVIDILFQTLKKINDNSELLFQYKKKFSFINNNNFKILLSVHRRENFGSPLKNIFLAINEISKIKNVQIIYSGHKNPNVVDAAKKYLRTSKNILYIDSLNYIDFVYLMDSVDFLISDSGGIQEEAPSLGKPNLVLRDYTERPEAIEKGSAVLVGTDKKNIINVFKKIYNNKTIFRKMSKKRNLYGSGKSYTKISEKILKILNQK